MDLLVGYQEAKTSKRVLEITKSYAEAFRARVHILSSTPYGPAMETEEYEAAKAALELVKRNLEGNGVDCETHLISNSLSPGEDLIDFARRESIDLIILGIRKKSKLGKFIMGSTAQYVTLEANCPVLAVK